jgi:hypothetical protein
MYKLLIILATASLIGSSLYSVAPVTMGEPTKQDRKRIMTQTCEKGGLSQNWMYNCTAFKNNDKE